jgi:hypothetical protein
LECINLTSKPRTVQFLTAIIDSREFASDNGEEEIEPGTFLDSFSLVEKPYGLHV